MDNATTKFKFNLGDQVSIAVSGETGSVISRAEHVVTPTPNYLIRYRTADGRATEQWWTEDALIPAQRS